MPQKIRYKIGNPYKNVDWSTWQAYKANLHTHSIASDGKDNLCQVIEAYYERDYDILAMTDHGIVGRGWDKSPKLSPIFSYQAHFGKLKPLSSKRYKEITSGQDRGGRGMTDLPLGIELNAAVLNKNHVNAFFVDYGQGKWGKENNYESVIKAVHDLGGLSHINHPGDWLGSAKDINIAKDPKNICFFADILKKYDSCLGIEVLNSRDRPTRYDRVLWDGLLERLIPAGRNVWGFANSDSHRISDIDTSFTYFILPKNDVNNIRKAMVDGNFFACGRYAKPELGEDFEGKGVNPLVTNITVDEERGQISVEGKDFDEIEWISKGEIISKDNTLDLNKLRGQVGSYVRFQLKGGGGICLSQPFIVDDGRGYEVLPSVPYFDSFFERFIYSLKSLRAYVIPARINKEIRKVIKKIEQKKKS